MLIAMSKHELDPNERRVDHQPPGLPRIGAVRVTRGRACPPGTWVEDADMGSVVIDIAPPADDRTPAAKMGYRLRYSGGKLPGAGMVPADDVRAIHRPDGGQYLVLYWKDGATSTHGQFQFILSIAAVDLGGNRGPWACVAIADPAVAPAPRDELPYDPRRLRIADEGAAGWLLTDGSSRMLLFDSHEDAQNGLAVAQRYTRQGFIGRDNRRPNHNDYLFQYWAGDSGMPAAPLSRTDAISYNPDNVTGVDIGPVGWRLQDGGISLVLATGVADAAAMLQVVKGHARMCFVGRGNNRPQRKAYIMTYWE